MAVAKRSSPQQNTSTRDLKQRVITCLNKLSDRDTHGIATTELESIVRNLTNESISPFLSCISDTDSSYKTPVRTQCVRLLASLSQTHGDSLAPFLPRMLANVLLRRLRDPDSAVRSACVDSVRTMASLITKPHFSVFLKPFSELLFLEQDYNSQIGSALCLASAIDAAPSLEPAMLQILVPKIVKLLKGESFKAKPALVALVGSIVGAGGASNADLLGILVPCVMEFLSSDDWAARKAAADALARLALTERDLLSEFKASCLASFERRRFDKVKAVRDTMNQMLEAWRDVPSVSEHVSPPLQSKSSSKGTEKASDGHFPTISKSYDTVVSSSLYTRKNKFRNSRSPSLDSASATTAKKHSPLTNDRGSGPALFRKLERKKTSDWKIEIAAPQSLPHTGVGRDNFQNCIGRDGKVLEQGETGESESTRRSKPEAKRVLFDKNCDSKTNKFSGLRSASRVVPFHGKEGSGSNATEELHGSNKDSDLSLISKKLVQIENQQSSLLDLLQRFIGSSQNGMRSLESRVHGLEMALDEISQDLAVSTGRMANTCCKLPGAEFLSSKFWRRTEGRYSMSSRFSSSSTPLSAMRNMADKEPLESHMLENQRFRFQGGLVTNPLAESHLQLRGTSEFCSDRTPTNANNITRGRQVGNCNRPAGASPISSILQADTSNRFS